LSLIQLGKITKHSNSSKRIIDFQTAGGYDTVLVMKTVVLGCLDVR
jgi:hypothetical protein